jgi:hypothetical protein
MMGKLAATAALSAIVLALLAAAAQGGGSVARQYLDEQTAATITVAGEPFVFARERSELAVNARDYVSLAPLEINRSGTRRQYWFGYLWSTIDRREGALTLAADDQLVLLADGRPIRLQSSGQSLRELGIGEPPWQRPGRAAVPLLFAAEPDTVAFIGDAAELSLLWIHTGRSETYSLWQDAREAVRGFVARLQLAGT